MWSILQFIIILPKILYKKFNSIGPRLPAELLPQAGRPQCCIIFGETAYQTKRVLLEEGVATKHLEIQTSTAACLKQIFNIYTTNQAIVF